MTFLKGMKGEGGCVRWVVGGVRIPETYWPLRLLLLQPSQDFLDYLPLFQADGQKNGFHRSGIGHVDSGAVVHFGPVKEAVECLLVFLAKGPPKWFDGKVFANF